MHVFVPLGLMRLHTSPRLWYMFSLRVTWFARCFLVVAVLLTCVPSIEAAPAAIKPPRLTRFVKADLPSTTPLKDVTVVLILTIETDGKVSAVTLQKSGGEPWDTGAVTAARKFVFQPATQRGKPVRVRVPFNYVYKIPARRGRILRPVSIGKRHPPERSPGYHYAGRLLEKGTRNPIAGVTVLLRDPRLPRRRKPWETISGKKGVFSFDGLTKGKLRLSLVAPGHKGRRMWVRSVDRPDGDGVAVQQTLYLRPDLFSQYRTVIVEKKKPEAAQEITLTSEELTKVPGTLGDPTRVVQTLPGVARSPFGLGYYIVRGSSFENTGFFVDGHPILFLYHLLGGPAVIHPELVGSLSFYPGGYPAKYGRFATGVIALTTKSPPDDRWHLDLSVDLLKASALFSVPFDDRKGQLTLSFRRSYYELILPAVQPDVGLGYTDYQVRLSYAFSDKLRLKLLVLGAEDYFGSANGSTSGSSTTAASGLTLGFHRVLTALDWDITPKVRWSNSMVWEYDHTSTYRTAEEDADLDFGLEGWFMQWRSYMTWRPSKRLKFEGGIDAFYAHFNSDFRVPRFPPLGDPRPPVFTPLITEFTIGGPFASLASYAMLDWEIAKGFRLLPGMRFTADMYAGQWHFSPDPRLSARVEVGRGWTLKAMGGMSHQQPAAFQTYEPLGDPNIPPVRGIQGSLGVEWEPVKGWEISLEGFYNSLSNIARPSSDLDTSNGGLNRVLWKADVSGRAHGLELLIRKRLGGRVHGWLSYTLSRAERIYPPGGWELFGLDQTHILNLAISIRLPREWTLGTRFTLTSGNPYYPVVDATYDADQDKYKPRFASEQDRLKLYHRLDLRIEKRWRFNTWMLEFFIDIQNVYNAANPETVVYSYDYKTRGAGTSIPILPTLGLRAIF
jgi:TonB family protein